MQVRPLSIALGCEVTETGSGATSATSNSTSQQQREAVASESWEDFERRCRSRTATTAGAFEEMIAAFRDDTTLPRTTIVWKKGDGLSRERLVLIRSCARLGRAEVVEGLLPFNFESSLLCEESFLDALRGDKVTVVSALLASNLFKPATGFLGYALAECGSARSASCASLLFDDKKCKVEALQQCNHERFGHPPWIYLRVLEDAITKAVHAGATDENSGSRSSGGSTPGRGQECLQLLASYGKSHLQDGEWERILRLAMGSGAEGPVCAVLRACPMLLVQAERLHFGARSQGASAQQTLGYADLLGLNIQDVSS